MFQDVKATGVGTNLDVIDVEVWIDTVVYKRTYSNGAWHWVRYRDLEPDSITLSPGQTGAVDHMKGIHHWEALDVDYKAVSKLWAAHSFNGGDVLGPPILLDEMANEYRISSPQ